MDATVVPPHAQDGRIGSLRNHQCLTGWQDRRRVDDDVAVFFFELIDQLGKFAVAEQLVGTRSQPSGRQQVQ